MKWSFAAGGMFLLGIIGVAAIILFQKLTTSNENDYYLLKEITESAMYDSIDIKYYRNTGNLRIVREKFVENFTRRFSESTLFIGTKYIISFYDIIEEPPKVSIFVNTGIENYRVYGSETEESYNVDNLLTGIFEYVSSSTNENNVYKHKQVQKTYYSMPGIDNGQVNVTEPLTMPTNLISNNIKNLNLSVQSTNILNPSSADALGKILNAKLNREIDWARAIEDNYRTDYTEPIDLSNYASSFIEGPNISTYNCLNDTGTKTSLMDCNKYNTVWISWNGRVNSSYSDLVLIINAVWEYDEYEY